MSITAITVTPWLLVALVAGLAFLVLAAAGLGLLALAGRRAG